MTSSGEHLGERAQFSGGRAQAIGGFDRATGEIVGKVCRKMAEMYSGGKTDSEKWSKMKILNLLGEDGWEMVHFDEMNVTEDGVMTIQSYIFKKRNESGTSTKK